MFQLNGLKKILFISFSHLSDGIQLTKLLESKSWPGLTQLCVLSHAWGCIICPPIVHLPTSQRCLGSHGGCITLLGRFPQRGKMNQTPLMHHVKPSHIHLWQDIWPRVLTSVPAVCQLYGKSVQSHLGQPNSILPHTHIKEDWDTTGPTHMQHKST